jgi:hypothetical protein
MCDCLVTSIFYDSMNHIWNPADSPRRTRKTKDDMALTLLGGHSSSDEEEASARSLGSRSAGVSSFSVVSVCLIGCQTITEAPTRSAASRSSDQARLLSGHPPISP